MKRIARVQFVVTVVVLATIPVITSGIGCCNDYVLPGFVGVPEAIDRSPDYTLMLTPDDTEELKDFLALGGDRMALEDGEDPDPGVRQQILIEYEPLLSRLSSTVPISTEDLNEGSYFRNLFDSEIGILTVHDARVDRDEDGVFFDIVGDRIVALVCGDFVFAFYLRRLEVESVQIHFDSEEIDSISINAWYLTGTTEAILEQNPLIYTGMVVFRKVYAIPGEGQ